MPMVVELKEGALCVYRILEVSQIFGTTFFVTFDNGRIRGLVYESEEEAQREREKILGAIRSLYLQPYPL
ncbi:MAG: hypothetical protein ACUVTO_09480 [Candidatus Caldatribacteriaceae bacterium]